MTYIVTVHWKYWCSNHEVVRQWPYRLCQWLLYYEEYEIKSFIYGDKLKDESYDERHLKLEYNVEDSEDIFPNEIYLEILKHTEPIDRVDVLCVCKNFMDLCLSELWRPWSFKSSKRMNRYLDTRNALCYKEWTTGLIWLTKLCL
jgi:hypothetical protein